MSNRFRIALLGATLIAALLIDYALARAGNPQSLWMWRDVLGLDI